MMIIIDRAMLWKTASFVYMNIAMLVVGEWGKRLVTPPLTLPAGAGNYFRRGFPPSLSGSKGDGSSAQAYSTVAANKMSFYDRGKYSYEVTVQFRDGFRPFWMTSADLERNGFKATSGKSVCFLIC
ncbi:MAG: hypothetical protein V9G20_26305 [Candidatus Promineifilaceae bacterium]